MTPEQINQWGELMRALGDAVNTREGMVLSSEECLALVMGLHLIARDRDRLIHATQKRD
jgi:hypothetical protein